MPHEERSPRAFFFVAALCLGSGCAALIYQVIWFQLLSLVIGASAVSLGVVLGTFMGGMCIGALAFPRLVATRHHPLRVFALVELAVGICGIAVLVAMPVLNNAYAALTPSNSAGMAGLLLRAVIAAVCLLPPTIAMGATLPAISRWLSTAPAGVRRMGICYAANIFGAVCGCLLAGFYLLPAHDTVVATVFAVTVNGLVGIAALIFARRNTVAPTTTATAGSATPIAPAVEAAPIEATWPIYVVTGLSGFAALSAEVIWTRHLSLLLGATVYTFAVVLAIFLLGLGCGSASGSFITRRLDPRFALACCQLLLAVAIVWTAWTITQFLPYWPLDVTLEVAAPVAMQLDLMRVLWAVLPAAVLWGASFPLALAASAAAVREPARLMARLYAANTLGAIAGAIGTSFVFIVWIGSQATQQLLVALSVASALLIALTGNASRARRLRPAALACLALLAGTAVFAVPALPGAFVAFGRFLPVRAAGSQIVYMSEGLTAPVAVSRQANGELTYHNAGKAQASTYPQDMRLQRMLGHLTTLVPENGRDYLVIGLGAGITAGAVAADPNAERVVIADIEPQAQRVAQSYFRAQNFGVVDKSSVEFRVDDGRHFLLTTEETFDGITSDPLDPWVKGAAALYTREFWQLAKSRLNAGGVVTVFVQLYETSEEAVKSELATFFSVFPNGAVFANTVQGRGYDVVLLAREDDAPIDLDRIDAALNGSELAPVAASLADVGFYGATDLFGTFAGRAGDFADWLEGAAINTDRNLRLQYLAGRGLNVYEAEAIYAGMSANGPADLSDYFTASPAMMAELRAIVRARYGQY